MNNKLQQPEMYTRKQLLYKLLVEQLGNIEPYGSTEIDNERYDNLNNYKFFIDGLVEDIDNCINKACDSRASELAIKNKALKYLKDLKEYIEDILNSYEESEDKQ